MKKKTVITVMMVASALMECVRSLMRHQPIAYDGLEQLSFSELFGDRRRRMQKIFQIKENIP